MAEKALAVISFQDVPLKSGGVLSLDIRFDPSKEQGAEETELIRFIVGKFMGLALQQKEVADA